MSANKFLFTQLRTNFNSKKYDITKKFNFLKTKRLKSNKNNNMHIN